VTKRRVDLDELGRSAKATDQLTRLFDRHQAIAADGDHRRRDHDVFGTHLVEVERQR